MSFTGPQPPSFNYGVQIWPWGQPFQAQDNNWVLWNSTALNPITLSFSNGLPVKSIWIPALTGPVTCYNGVTATGTPFFVTQGAGSELIPVNVDTLDVTLVGSGGDMYVYYTSLVLDPFRQGVIGNQVTAVTATLPIISSGGTQPNISLQVPLAITYGGTGTSTPVGVAAAPSSGIIVTGSFPDQTLSLDFAGLGIITGVAGTPPIGTIQFGTVVTVFLSTPLAWVYGGTQTSTPGTTNTSHLGGATPGAGIAVTGTTFDENTWTFTNIGVTSLTGDTGPTETGDITLQGAGGIVVEGSGSTMTIDGTGVNGVAKMSKLSSPPSAATLTIHVGTGNWLVTTYCIGLAITASDGSHVATVTLSTGGIGGFDDNQFQREAWITDIFTGPGTITSTAAVSGSGWSINSHYSYASFVLQATPLQS